MLLLAQILTNSFSNNILHSWVNVIFGRTFLFDAFLTMS